MTPLRLIDSGKRGIGGPRDLPQEVLDVLVPAMRKIHESAAFRDLMKQRGFGLAYAELDEFRAYIIDKDGRLWRRHAAARARPAVRQAAHLLDQLHG